MRHISSATLNQFNHRSGRVIDIDEFLAALDQHLLVHVWITNKDSLPIDRLRVEDQSLVEGSDVFQRLDVEFLLIDTGAEHVVLLSGWLASAQSIISLLKVFKELHG